MSEMLLVSEQSGEELGAPLPTCLFKQPGTQNACPGSDSSLGIGETGFRQEVLVGG